MGRGGGGPDGSGVGSQADPAAGSTGAPDEAAPNPVPRSDSPRSDAAVSAAHDARDASGGPGSGDGADPDHAAGADGEAP
ncbi:hypothetical protein DT87_25385 [Streptomyces sp. NTK 937]|nr:hypothetical protein DT87_25385 [Streptomyces sp. NTK 937]